MKKIILLGAFIVTGLVNAKDAKEIKPTKEGEKKEIAKKEVVKETKAHDRKVLQMHCYEYAMYIPCKDSFLTDTQCWGPGSGTATWEDAWNCIQENGENAVDFFCNS